MAIHCRAAKNSLRGTSNDYILYCMIIINVVLTLQVSTTCLSHDHDPRELKVVFNHTCSLHTCICAWGAQEASTPIGSCRRGNATLLGVSQVTLFCSGLCRTELAQKKVVSDSPEVNLNVTKQLFTSVCCACGSKLLVQTAHAVANFQPMLRILQQFASVCCAYGSNLLAYTAHMVTNCQIFCALLAYAAHVVANCQHMLRMQQPLASVCYTCGSNLLAQTAHVVAKT